MINFMIFGPRGSGKDTVAHYLNTEYGIKKIRLAGYVERACKALGIDKPTKEDLVYIGTEVGRKYVHPDVWIDMADNEIRKNSQVAHVITDIRFKNEYEYFLMKGYVPIRLEISENIRVARLYERDGHLTESLANHETEQLHKQFHGYTINNDSGKISDLHEQLDRMLRQFSDLNIYAQYQRAFMDLHMNSGGNK